MHFKSAVAILAAVTHLAVAAPGSTKEVEGSLMRLIKTSEEDPGQWMTQAEVDNLTKQSRRTKFIDITDIQDDDVLSILSTPPSERSIEARAVTYPTTMTHVTEANSLISGVSNTGPQSWLTSLTNYQNRYYRSTYGTQAGTWLLNLVKSIASANSAIQVRTFAHSFNQPSIIARIPGSSSNLVIVGAHYDSTAGSATARAPGADDNGSGTINCLEALRILANAGFKPKNTLEFHFYGGEEGGLLGSQGVFNSYRSSGETVLAFLNQDMTGYSPGGKATVYTDYVDSSLTSYVILVARQYSGLAVSTSTCGYGCSDHASARAAGFPASYLSSEPIETENQNIHSSRDTYASIQWPSILRHSKITVGFLVEASYL
ncbi:leucyl aminopeptidase [Ilyonectria robusta]|uniref:leucyl aminopeptidase n=1 Tax=Ilyonectria robusta TaxID=1079257 RepID=UPI001E8D09BE|nr:leucyl aminopeptidase [Ilyonectria robusta]KAH8679326.1 leucyl aminopeptidase [Ilyonectria robusta]